MGAYLMRMRLVGVYLTGVYLSQSVKAVQSSPLILR
jgi:hypothetical protein